LLHWYFVSRIAKNDGALRDLRAKKKQLLEDVMETETYKKAKEILEKFDPARFKKLEDISEKSATKPVSGTPGTAMQHRNTPRQVTPSNGPILSAVPRSIRPPGVAPPRFSATPRPMGMQNASRGPTPTGGQATPQMQPRMGQQMATPRPMGRGFVPQPGPPMPRSVLPRERGAMDKLMDYLVGDGPENRYALICQQCHSHNGMALKDEFEYLHFRCCYCYFLNPARKQRPFAPKMEFFTPLSKTKQAQAVKTGEESDDDEEEEEESSSEEEENVPDNKQLDASDKTKHPSQTSLNDKSEHSDTVKPSVKQSGIPLKQAPKLSVAAVAEKEKSVNDIAENTSDVSTEKAVDDVGDGDVVLKAEIVSDDSGGSPTDNQHIEGGNPDVVNGKNDSAMDWAEVSTDVKQSEDVSAGEGGEDKQKGSAEGGDTS